MNATPETAYRMVADTEPAPAPAISDGLLNTLRDIGAPWGQHWIRGGWNGTAALQNELDGGARPRPASERVLDALAALEATQRQGASTEEREWQYCVGRIVALRGELLSAATVQERKRVADKLAQAVQALVMWGFER